MAIDTYSMALERERKALARAEAAEAREQALLRTQTDLINDTVLMGMARDEALAEVTRLSHALAEAEAANWRVYPNSHTVGAEPDPFEGPGETYADAYQRLLVAIAAETAKREAMERALDRLARLGNEPHYGISKGNDIARATLAKHGSKT